MNEGTFNFPGGSLIITAVGTPSPPTVIQNVGPPFGNGVFNITGGTLFPPNGGLIDNSGTFNVHGVVTLPAVSNTSAFNVTDSTVIYTDAFTNDGSYTSDSPSTRYFTSMDIGPDADLAGGAGDVFSFGEDLTNNSSGNATFDLTRCWVVFSGNGATHQVTWTGADLGAVVGGYTNNFATGVLFLHAGNSLTLLNGNPTQNGAIYTEVLRLEGGIAQIASIATDGHMSIYYDPHNTANTYLGGITYQLNGGGVIAPVPDRTPPPDQTPSPTVPPTGSPTPTPTPTPTGSPTPTPTPTPTGSPAPTPTITPTPTPTPTPCMGRCSPTPRPRETPRARPTPPPHITPVPPPPSPRPTPWPRPTPPPHLTPPPTPSSPRPTPAPRPSP